MWTQRADEPKVHVDGVCIAWKQQVVDTMTHTRFLMTPAKSPPDPPSDADKKKAHRKKVLEELGIAAGGAELVGAGFGGERAGSWAAAHRRQQALHGVQHGVEMVAQHHTPGRPGAHSKQYGSDKPQAFEHEEKQRVQHAKGSTSRRAERGPQREKYERKKSHESLQPLLHEEKMGAGH